MNIKQRTMKTIKKVNVAPSSTEGHFVENHKRVIDLESPSTESYIVEGDAILTTKNHTSLKITDDCLINAQKVYNPFSKSFEISKD